MVSCVQDGTSRVPKIVSICSNEDTFDHNAHDLSMVKNVTYNERAICGLTGVMLVLSHGTGIDWWCSVEVQVVDVEV